MNCRILALAFMSLFLLGGCVQMDSETIINKDGSGTMQMTVSMSEEMVNSLEEIQAMSAGMQQQQADMPNLDDITKENIEKAAKGHGVKIKSFEKGVKEGRFTLAFDLEFKDLEGVSYVMDAIQGRGSGKGLGIVATDDGNFRLKDVDYDYEVPVREKSSTDTPSSMEMNQEKQMELAGKMMAAMSELHVSMRITVPGEVVSSTAHRVEGNTSIWEINPENMMSMQEGMEPDIVFSCKDMKLKK